MSGGFARLVGMNGFDFYIRDLSVLMGRRSIKTPYVLSIGDGKLLSRHHATIFYDIPSSEWRIKILGKNGVKITQDGTTVTYDPTSSPVILKHGARIEVCDFWFFFLKPQGQFDPPDMDNNEPIFNLCNKAIEKFPEHNFDPDFIYKMILEDAPWLGGDKFPNLPRIIQFLVAKAAEQNKISKEQNSVALLNQSEEQGSNTNSKIQQQKQNET